MRDVFSFSEWRHDPDPKKFHRLFSLVISHRPTGLRAAYEAVEANKRPNKELAFRKLFTRIYNNIQNLTPLPLIKVRTYDFPTEQVIDHRLEDMRFPLTNVLDGELDPIFDAIAQLK